MEDLITMEKTMEKLSEFLVKKRRFIFCFMLVFAVISVFLMNHVNIVTDMTTYLPDNSAMKQGMDIMNSEFPDAETEQTIRVMADGLSAEQKEELLSALQGIDNVSSVDYDSESADYNKDSYTLYILNTSYAYDSAEVAAITDTIQSMASDWNLVYDTGEIAQQSVPPMLIVLALAILMAILFFMCNSWVEPFLFLATIAIAIVINMGTNAFLSGVSETTYSIAAILQLVLSMDYSIILMNRYRQELKKSETINAKAINTKTRNGEITNSESISKEQAMTAAIKNAFSSVTSSSLTTIVGLLALIFMDFKIGADMGIVLAKGVLISLICILTVLPALILAFDKAIQKTAKKVLPLPMDGISRFSFRGKYGITGFFAVLFVVLYLLKGNTLITYSMTEQTDVDKVFPKTNTLVVVYENKDEDAIAALASEFGNDPSVKSVMTYSTTLGKEYTASELVTMLQASGFQSSLLNENTVSILYQQYFGKDNYDASCTMTMEQLFDEAEKLVANKAYAALIPASMADSLTDFKKQLEEGKAQMVGEDYSRMILMTRLDEESDETTQFLSDLSAKLDGLSGKSYVIGSSAMEYEMAQTFDDELNKISLITMLAIFIVVLAAFRSVAVPVILVLVIQGAVYATMVIMGIAGGGMYYLALLIVQSILMGATIDYGILFSNYYRENRKTQAPDNALTAAYNGSIHTIMTSGLIMVLVTFILGFAFGDPATGQICHIISAGVLCAIILVLFVLPGILCALDKFTSGVKANK